MEVRLGLTLPCDSRSVSLVRAACGDALVALGVTESCVDEIQLAVGEACANVLQHAESDEDYDVALTVEGNACVVEVVDRGRGFSGARDGFTPAPDSAEHGRGVHLMRAFVDRLRFDSVPDRGTSVHMVKSLDYEPDSPLGYLTDASTR